MEVSRRLVLKFYVGIKGICDSLLSNLIKAIFIMLSGTVKTFLPSPTKHLTNVNVTFKEIWLAHSEFWSNMFHSDRKTDLCSAPPHPITPPVTAWQLLAIPREFLSDRQGFSRSWVWHHFPVHPKLSGSCVHNLLPRRESNHFYRHI